MTAPPRRTPLPIAIPAVVGVALLALPVVGLLQRAPWSTMATRLTSPEILDAVRISLIVSLSAALVCIVLGLPLAWVLARHDHPLISALRVLVLLPMVLPPVVGGTALLFALGRRGLFGEWLDRGLGVTLPFTTAGAVVAASFVALPFFVTTVESALRDGGVDLEEAAAATGASPWRTFVHVTLPVLRPAVAAGVALSWARALGEFGATITFAGSLGGRTRTLPVETFLALEQDPETAIAVSVLLLAVSLSVLAVLRGRWLTR
ncbi:MAG: ABC transporter permease [Acidimicrobiales bacterium]